MKALLLVLALLLVSPNCYASSLEETFAKAQNAFKSAQYDEAGTLFKQVAGMLNKQGNAAQAHAFLNNAAIAYMKGENYTKAIETYEDLLKNLASLDAASKKKFFQNLAACYNDAGQYALKADCLERMLQAKIQLENDELVNVYAQLGDAYRRAEIYSRSISYYEKAHKLLSTLKVDSKALVEAKILTAIGLAQGNIGDFENATKNLEIANNIALQSNSFQTIVESNSNLGTLYLERGEYAQAQKLLEEAISVAQTNALRENEGADQNNIGLLFKNLGKYKDAMERFDTALSIAKEIQNKRDEGIAIVNKALLYRMTGQLNQARSHYGIAEQIFRDINFKEGVAGALLGQGVIACREDRNYDKAIELYHEALEIYNDLGLVRAQAETYIQLGNVLKKVATPNKRVSRDLVFEDDVEDEIVEVEEVKEVASAPQDAAAIFNNALQGNLNSNNAAPKDAAPQDVAPQDAASKQLSSMQPDQALAEAKQAYQKALSIAQDLFAKELMWSAWQGIGFCQHQEGKLDEAYANYMQAIDMVTGLRTNLASASLLGEYMANKEDLYDEAREVCSDLFSQTKKQEYLEKQIQLDETLRNEIAKASAALAQLDFSDPKKQASYAQLLALGKQQEKAEAAIPVIIEDESKLSKEEKKINALKKEEAAKQKELVQKLDGEYAQLLASWESEYPEDALIFESNARIDIKKIQANLAADQAVIQYLPLHDKLIIIAISNTSVEQYAVHVSQVELDRIIKQKFLLDYIENGYGRGKNTNTEEEAFLEVCTTLHSLYEYLVKPAEAFIADKKKLYFVASGFLAQVPFVALPTTYSENNAEFLVEKFDISQVRPSFIESLTIPETKDSLKTLLAVGNPSNKNIWMAPLDGAAVEVQNVYNTFGDTQNIKDVQYRDAATESWLVSQLQESKYEYIYFATHGMPSSNLYTSYYIFLKKYDDNPDVLVEKYQKRLEKAQLSGNPQKIQNSQIMLEKAMGIANGRKYIDMQLNGLSPMNGYLYMGPSSSVTFDGNQKALLNKEDGLFTIAEIMGLDQKSFISTNVVVLSACNTGVTFVPAALQYEEAENLMSSKEIEKNMRDMGWVPGIDQVSFVDVFMRRGVKNVYGTLWFADDKANEIIMSNFMKNLEQQEGTKDTVKAYCDTLRSFIQASRSEQKPFPPDYASVPLHPYFWAVGAIFGK